jgi:hypothetical protein
MLLEFLFDGVYCEALDSLIGGDSVQEWREYGEMSIRSTE